MNNVIDDGFNIQNIQRILGILDGVECKLVRGQDFLSGAQLGNLHPRPDELERLRDELAFWAGTLADTLGVPLYPYSTRGQRASGVGGNIPVRHN